MKSIFRKFLLICLMILLSCKQSSPAGNINVVDPDTAKTVVVNEDNIYPETKDDAIRIPQISIDTLANRFIENLAQGKNLTAFFSNKWTLIYHTDNRCDGSTDGKSANLDEFDIDKDIRLSVKNDGDGWACEKSAPTDFNLIFNLKKEVKSWDRFIIANYQTEEKNTIYINGKGESDYLKLYFNEDNLITKLEYRSEDPG